MFFKNPKFILISLIVLAAVSAGGYFGYNYLLNTPEKIFLRSITKFSSAQSFSFDGNLSFSFNTKDFLQDQEFEYFSNPFNNNTMLPLKEEVSFKIDFKGDLETESTSTLKSQGSFSFYTDMLPFEISFDYIALPEALYIKHKNLDFILSTFLPPSLVKNYLSGWVQIKYEDLGEFSRNQLLFKNQKSNLLKAQVSTYETLEYLNKISNIIIRSKVLIVKKEGTETIGGVKTEKFYVSFDREKIIPTLKEINNILPPEIRAKESEFVALEKELGKIEKMPNFYFYINPSDELLYRVTYSYEIKSESLKSPIPMNLRIDFSNYNKKFEIKPPENYKDFKEIIKELQNFSFETTPSSENETLYSIPTTTYPFVPIPQFEF